MESDTLPDIGQDSTETIDGLRIRLSRSGRADGVPVLFTSPWPESIYAFHRVLPDFVGTYPVVAIDLPGFGLSESRPEIMSPKATGTFLVKVAAHLKLPLLQAAHRVWEEATETYSNEVMSWIGGGFRAS